VLVVSFVFLFCSCCLLVLDCFLLYLVISRGFEEDTSLARGYKFWVQCHLPRRQCRLATVLLLRLPHALTIHVGTCWVLPTARRVRYPRGSGVGLAPPSHRRLRAIPANGKVRRVHIDEVVIHWVLPTARRVRYRGSGAGLAPPSHRGLRAIPR
jgi:hypothetical protein